MSFPDLTPDRRRGERRQGERRSMPLLLSNRDFALFTHAPNEDEEPNEKLKQLFRDDQNRCVTLDAIKSAYEAALQMEIEDE